MNSISLPDDIENWPTSWKMIDVIQGVEVRQLSLDTFEIRNASHITQINREGFNLYRTSHKDFERWIDENLIESYEREPHAG